MIAFLLRVAFCPFVATVVVDIDADSNAFLHAAQITCVSNCESL